MVDEVREVGVRIERGSYKMRYERGREDVLWRRRGDEEMRVLGERAVAREEERRRRAGRVLER